MLSKDKNAPKSSGHGNALATAVLPAARKKSNERCFPANSSCNCRSVECARSKRSSDGALPRLVCTEEAVRARRSYGGGVGKTEEEKGDERRRHKLYMTARKQEEATRESSPC